MDPKQEVNEVCEEHGHHIIVLTAGGAGGESITLCEKCGWTLKEIREQAGLKS